MGSFRGKTSGLEVKEILANQLVSIGGEVVLHSVVGEFLTLT